MTNGAQAASGQGLVRFGLVAALMLTVAFALSGVEPAGAAFPGKNGKIVYSSYDNDAQGAGAPRFQVARRKRPPSSLDPLASTASLEKERA
jgi:hypothetical protein